MGLGALGPIGQAVSSLPSLAGTIIRFATVDAALTLEWCYYRVAVTSEWPYRHR